MQRAIGLIVASILLAGLVGCSSRSAQAPAPAAAAAPAGSKLAEVKIGMTKKQVKDILGPPTDENSYSTGKVWIPFYFGNDARRTSFYYKGVGRVVFADGNAFGGGSSEVVRVDYDPTESGNAR
ncbi:outer membrane protein assembly factor BamE [bacterium]|nr:outer membrane protein assembly factor BamE [bacterium]